MTNPPLTPLLSQLLDDLVLERIEPIEPSVAAVSDRHSDLVAGDDRAAIAAWLREYQRRPNTLRTYQRELRRFHLWMVAERHIGLVDLTRQDLADYDAFLAAPPASWLPAKADGEAEPPSAPFARAWRPLKAPLNAYRRRDALVIIQICLQYLCDEGYLTRNPARLVRDKGRAPPRKRRTVPEASTMQRMLAGLVGHAEQLASREPGSEASALARRDVLVWAWVYWLGARRHELAHALRGSIHQRAHGGTVQWWWTVHGKGELEADIPVATPAVEALAWYMGCPVDQLVDQLSATAAEPLIERVRGTAVATCVSPGEIYASVRRGAGVIAELALASQLARLDVEAFARARPHDLRAFRATHLLDAGTDPRHVQRLLRHADINTTLLYDHTRDTRFHDSVEVQPGSERNA